MKRLIEHFCDAIDEYLAVTAEHPDNVAGYLMMITGGERQIKGDGALSEAELAHIEPEKRTGSQIHGHFKVSHLRNWLNYLYNEIGIMDILLVPSLIKYYRQYLISMAFDEEIQERRQKIIERLESYLVSKELRDEYFEKMSMISKKGLPSSEEEKTSYINKELAFFKNFKPESDLKKRDKVRVWEEKMKELATEKYINEYLSEIAREYIENLNID